MADGEWRMARVLGAETGDSVLQSRFKVGWSHVGAEQFNGSLEFDEFAAGETRAFAIQPELQEVGHALFPEAMLGPVQSIGQFVSGDEFRGDLVPFQEFNTLFGVVLVFV